MFTQIKLKYLKPLDDSEAERHFGDFNIISIVPVEIGN